MPVKKTKGGYTSTYGGKKKKHKTKAAAMKRRKTYSKRKV